MDQYPGSGGSGEYQAPLGYAPAYAPVQAPPAKKKKLWLWIGGGAVLAAAVVLVLVFVLVPGKSAGAEPQPLLFAEDDEVYLAVGAETIALEDAAIVGRYNELNGRVSVDGRTLYYLADVSSRSGEGSLMGIALGSAKASPERIAEDVYAAKISADDKKVLYLSGYKDGTCDLFICTPGGKATMIDEDVSSWCFGFSPNGSLVYYATVDKSGDYTLLTYSGGKSEEIVDIDDGTLAGVLMDDGGRIMYKVYSSDKYEYTMYLYENGSEKRICRDDSYIYTYPTSGRADEFLYVADDTLYYYARGDEERISKSFGSMRLPDGIYDPRKGYGTHFVFSETGSTDTLYEVNLPGDPVKITKTDGSYAVGDGFRCVACVSDDNLYLVKKSGGSWGTREKICKDPNGYAFDKSGKYIYYIALGRNGVSGDFCRRSLSSGEEEVLLDSAISFRLSGDRAFAVDEDNDAYAIVGAESKRMEKNISALYEASGGVYMAGNNGRVYFYSDTAGESERVSSDAVVIGCYGAIIGAFD